MRDQQRKMLRSLERQEKMLKRQGKILNPTPPDQTALGGFFIIGFLFCLFMMALGATGHH